MVVLFFTKNHVVSFLPNHPDTSKPNQIHEGALRFGTDKNDQQ